LAAETSPTKAALFPAEVQAKRIRKIAENELARSMLYLSMKIAEKKKMRPIVIYCSMYDIPYMNPEKRHLFVISSKMPLSCF